MAPVPGRGHGIDDDVATGGGLDPVPAVLEAGILNAGAIDPAEREAALEAGLHE